jgi:hypothetical protein
MKKVAASADDEARIKATGMASASVRLERELRTRVPAGFRAADRLTRDEIHQRDDS